MTFSWSRNRHVIEPVQNFFNILAVTTRPSLTRLELARLAARLQQQELAKLAGIAPGRLSVFERAHELPSDLQQNALCDALRYPRLTIFPAGCAQLGEDMVRQWLLSLNDEGSAARPSLVKPPPVQGRREQA